MPSMIGDYGIKACWEDVKLAKAYLGDIKVYSAGNVVTYMVDTDLAYKEEVDSDASCLSPATFTPIKEGWTFIGWREDTTASGDVLSSKVMGDEPITLYAVFAQEITLSYNGNGSTSGSTESEEGTRYYNNENIDNPTFTLSANGFVKTYYNFIKWAIGSASGTQYAVGDSVILSASTVFYAVWIPATITAALTASGGGWDSPNIIYNWYSTAYDLTNVKTITITFSGYYDSYEPDEDAKYYYDIFKWFVGISTNKSAFTALRSMEYGYCAYETPVTKTNTVTIDVSSYKGLYYIGAAVQGYDGHSGGQLVGVYDSTYYTKITRVSFA